MSIDLGKLFPAHAGMNRDAVRSDYIPLTVPRTRGDEPRGLAGRPG